MEFDHSTETISPDDTVTTISIGGTGGLVLPSGTTAQRPANTVGLIRWNNETASLEINNGTSWNGAGGATGMAAGTVSAPGWAFTANATTGIYQPATGVLSFAAGGGEQFRIIDTANAVNYLTVTGNTGTNGPILGASGTATNIDIYMQPKGAGAVYAMNPSGGLIYGVFNNAGATSSTQYITFSNATTGNSPYIQANGTDSNVSITMIPKGTGGVIFNSGPIVVSGSAGTSGQVLTSGGPGVSPTWTTVSGGGGAPTDATYLTLSTNATLTGERTLTTNDDLIISDGGAGNNAIVGHRYGGESWTTTTAPSSANGWRGLAYGNGTFVSMDGGASSTAGMYSTDGGVTWSASTMPGSAMWNGCAYGNGIFVAAQAPASNSVATSTNGITWTLQSAVLPDTSTHSCVSFIDGTFYIPSYNTTTMSRSSNGTVWQQSTLPASAAWQGCGGHADAIIAVASGTTTAARSTDGGASWSAVTLPASLDWRAVAYGAGVFIAVASTASNNQAARSIDNGVTWTALTLPSTQTWYDVIYANGQFIAIGTGSVGAWSRDGGVTWTSFTAPFANAYRILYGGGKLVTTGTGTNVAYSSCGNANSAMGEPQGLIYADMTGYNVARNVGIDGESLWLAPSNYSAPPARGLNIFGREYGPPNGGRSMLAVVGPSGMDYPLQPALWRQGVALWRPPGNATTVPGVFGFNAPTAGGTATARNVATTNALTRTKRLGYVSSTTAGNYGGHYSTQAQYTVGTGSIGGFMYSCRFGVSDATLQTVARTFVGVSSSVSAPFNVDPATLTNSIGIGHTASDTTWYIYYGGSAAQTRISLGANFPINNTDLIDITLWSPPNQNGVVFYHVTRITATTQYETSGKLGPGTAGTTLPANSTLLAHRAWRHNNTAAAAVGIDIASIYWETDW